MQQTKLAKPASIWRKAFATMMAFVLALGLAPALPQRADAAAPAQDDPESAPLMQAVVPDDPPAQPEGTTARALRSAEASGLAVQDDEPETLYYATLRDAFNAACGSAAASVDEGNAIASVTGSTVMLLSDVDAVTDYYIPVTKQVELNLANHRITFAPGANALLFYLHGEGSHLIVNATTGGISISDSSTAFGLFYVSGDSKLELNGGEYTGRTVGSMIYNLAGKKTGEGDSATYAGASITLNNVNMTTTRSFLTSSWSDWSYGSLVVNGGAYTMNSAGLTGGQAGFQPCGFKDVTFKGVTITSQIGACVEVMGPPEATCPEALAKFEEGNKFAVTQENTVSGYSFYGSAIAVSNGERFAVTGGEYSAPYGYGIYVFSSNGVGEVSGGVVEGGKAAVRIDRNAYNDADHYPGTPEVDVSGGEVKGKIQLGNETKSVITGGSFTEKPDASLLAEGYLLPESAEGLYVVQDDPAYVAQVAATGKRFKTLSEAVSAAMSVGSGSGAAPLVEVLQDISIGEAITISKSVEIRSASKLAEKPKLADTSITVSRAEDSGDIALTVAGLEFTGTSYISAGEASKLEVSNCIASGAFRQVGSGHPRFIVLDDASGDGSASGSSGLEVALIGNKVSYIPASSGSDQYGAAVSGNAPIATALITDNTFGAEGNGRFLHQAVHMTLVEDALLSVHSNRVYGSSQSTDFTAFSLDARSGAVSVITHDNAFDVYGVDASSAFAAYAFKVDGPAECAASVIDLQDVPAAGTSGVGSGAAGASGSTVNGSPITLAHLSVPAGGYVGVDVVRDLGEDDSSDESGAGGSSQGGESTSEDSDDSNTSGAETGAGESGTAGESVESGGSDVSDDPSASDTPDSSDQGDESSDANPDASAEVDDDADDPDVLHWTGKFLSGKFSAQLPDELISEKSALAKVPAQEGSAAWYALVHVKQIAVSPLRLDFDLGSGGVTSGELVATVVCEPALPAGVEAPVTWTSDSPSVASVTPKEGSASDSSDSTTGSAASTVTATVRAVAGGSTTIRASSANQSIECPVTVKPAPVPPTPPTPVIRYYTATFADWNGEVLSSGQVEAGKVPTYSGATPMRDTDAYVYGFTTWNPKPSELYEDTTYTAAYEVVNANWSRLSVGLSVPFDGISKPLVVTGVYPGDVVSYAFDDVDYRYTVGEEEPPAPFRLPSDSGSVTVTVTRGDFSITVEAPVAITAPPAGYQMMYRVYNPNSGEHFYTSNWSEVQDITAAGWLYEHEEWTAPLSGAPVYRLYSGTDHHYTTDADEQSWLISLGWSDEGIGWYSAGEDGVALYRLYNPNVDPSAASGNAGSHHYTTDPAEAAYLESVGWIPEGIGWYGAGWTLP